MDLELYGSSLSPFVRKVRACMLEKGIDCVLTPVSPFDPPEGWRKLSPLGRIPVLRDRALGREGPEGTLADSSAICVYLERMRPEPRLYPADPFAHARALWYEEYADTELAVRIGFGIWRTVVVGPLSGQEPDWEAAEATVREKLPRAFAYLEEQLVADAPYLTGTAPAIGDIAVAAQLIGLLHAGFAVDAVAYPRLAAWLDRMLSRPSLATLIAEDRESLGPHSRM